MRDTVLGITSVGFHLRKRRKKISETVHTLGPRCSQFAKTQEASVFKVNDPIADLRRAVAGFRPGQERLAASRGAMATEVKRTAARREGMKPARPTTGAAGFLFWFGRPAASSRSRMSGLRLQRGRESRRGDDKAVPSITPGSCGFPTPSPPAE